jgi:hypothetical protein
MNHAFKLARYYGISISFADLGECGVDELRSEYDPSGPFIRINVRSLENMKPSEAGEFITMAVGHEIYHHREHTGEIPKLESRADREKAANEFAHEMLVRS